MALSVCFGLSLKRANEPEKEEADAWMETKRGVREKEKRGLVSSVMFPAGSYRTSI